MTYCEAHVEMVKSVARLETKLDAIPKQISDAMEPMRDHIKQGERWRLAVVGIIFAGIIQIVTFAYFWGALNNTVQRDTVIINEMLKGLITQEE